MKMMPENMLRAGVIGLGVGAHQARSLYMHPHCQLTWICDFDESRLSAIGSELPRAKITIDAQEVLSDPSVDLVSVASYDEAHYDQVITALENGKHVYVEKPVCLSENELASIHAALKKHPDLRLSSNLVLRTCPLFSHVREIVQSKKIGEVYHLEGDYYWGRVERITSGWRAEADFYSIIHGAAVHMVDLLLWLTGKRPVSVQAMGSHIAIAGSRQHHNDFAIMLLEFEDRMSAKVAAHGGCVHPHFHSLKVFGTNCTFIHEVTGSFWIDSSNPNDTFRHEYAEYPAKEKRGEAIVSFVEAILNKKERPLVTEKEVFDTMSVCLAAERSVNTGKIEAIDYLDLDYFWPCS